MLRGGPDAYAGSTRCAARGPALRAYRWRIDIYLDLLRFSYNAALAFLIGGGIAVGLAAAGIFSSVRSRGEAANVFAAVLSRFDGLGLLALIVVVASTVLKLFAFEEDLRDWRILVRYLALAVMSTFALYAIAYAGPVARSIRKQTPGFDDLPDGDVRRREFRALHQRSRRALSSMVVLGLIALYFS